MKAAAWAIEALQAVTVKGKRASCTAGVLAALLKAFAPRGRRVLANLDLVYPDSTERWRREFRSAVYENLAWTVTEILALQRDPRQALDWIVDVDGFEVMERNLAAGRGVLFLSGHFGNWELLAAWYAQYLKKFDSHDFFIVSQRTRDKDIARLITQYRENAGIRLLHKKTSVFEMAKVLKAGGHLAALADISWLHGVELPFMGHLCKNTTGPAVLSLVASAPIVPVAIYREAPFRHRVRFFEPLSMPDEKEHRRKIELMTTAVNDALEQIIRSRPEQWFWLHDRWKQ